MLLVDVSSTYCYRSRVSILFMIELKLNFIFSLP
jgi:hypothetical protein